MEHLELYIPKLEDLWFYQKMMSDPETMSYNSGWDVDYAGYHRDTGCIDYPDEVLPDWYADWVGQEPERFYAYIKRSSDGTWIGDVNFHYNQEKDWWDMGIVIYAPYRSRGYAVPALKLLLDRAFRICGVSRLHNDFETTRDAAWVIHCKVGFDEVGTEDGLVHLIITKEGYYNAKMERICDRFSASVQINTISDNDAPRFKVSEENGVHFIVLNAAKIPMVDYPTYVGYYVRQLLLPQLKLETERLVLRRYQPQDAEQCFTFLSNEQDAYMDCCKAFTVMDEAYHERVALFGQRETQYMVTLKESGEVIGTVNVFADNARAVDSMEIGYSIAHTHQRKGYAYEALSALLDLLQSDLYLDMVTAGVLPENVASENLLLKLGFQKEGLRHKAVWHEGLDKPVDLIYYYRDRA